LRVWPRIPAQSPRLIGTILAAQALLPRFPISKPEDTHELLRHAENVKTDEQATKLFEDVTEFIDENPESAEAASNALDAILRTYPSDNATTPPTFSVGDLPSPPHLIDNDMFLYFINHSAFDDPTPELVADSPLKPG